MPAVVEVVPDHGPHQLRHQRGGRHLRLAAVDCRQTKEVAMGGVAEDCPFDDRKSKRYQERAMTMVRSHSNWWGYQYARRSHGRNSKRPGVQRLAHVPSSSVIDTGIAI